LYISDNRKIATVRKPKKNGVFVKKVIILLVLVLSFNNLISEPTAEDYIKMGISEHEKGNYESALKFYDKVIETGDLIDYAYYEKGMTYSVMGNQEKSLEMGEKLIEAATRDDLMAMGYMLKGNALDYLGNPLESIEVYLEGIDETDFFMLHFNLAMTYQGLNMDSLALISLSKTVEENLLFPSSHYYIGINYYEEQLKSKAILATTFFLILPQTKEDRRVISFENIMSVLNMGINRTDSNVVNINMIQREDNSRPFSSSDLMISLTLAIDTNTIKNPYTYALSKNLDMVLNVFEINGDDEIELDMEQFLFDYYISFFLEADKEGHMETLVRIACSIKDVESEQWMIDNEDKVAEFYKFFINHFELEEG